MLDETHPSSIQLYVTFYVAYNTNAYENDMFDRKKLNLSAQVKRLKGFRFDEVRVRSYVMTECDIILWSLNLWKLTRITTFQSLYDTSYPVLNLSLFTFVRYLMKRLTEI